jgi:hypothetical protein
VVDLCVSLRHVPWVWMTLTTLVRHISGGMLNDAVSCLFNALAGC